MVVSGDAINAPRVLNCSTGVKFSKIIYTTGSITGTIYYSDCTVTSTSVTTPTIYNETTLNFDFYDNANNKFYSIFGISLGYPSTTLDSSYETARDAAVWNSSSSGTKKSGGLRTKLNPMGGFKKSSSPSGLEWNSTPIYAPTATMESFNHKNQYIVPIPVGIYIRTTANYWSENGFYSYNINTSSIKNISSGSSESGCYYPTSSQGINYHFNMNEVTGVGEYLLKTTSDFSTYTSTSTNNNFRFGKIIAFKKGIIGCYINKVSTIRGTNLSAIVASDATTISSSETYYDIIYAGELTSMSDSILMCTSAGIYNIVVDKYASLNSFSKSSNDVLYSLYKTDSQSGTIYDCIACGPSGSFCKIKNISSSSLTLQYYTVDNSEDFNACCYGNGIYLVGSNSGKLYLSTDLTNWALNHTFDGQICSIAYSCNKFFVMIEKNSKISIYVSK